MKVILCPLVSYDIPHDHVFEVEDSFIPNSANALRLLKDIRRQHKIHGKAFILRFPQEVFYFYRIKNGYKQFRIGEPQ